MPDKLRDYLATVAGIAPAFEPVPRSLTGKLPLFVRERYRWRTAELFGHECLFALEKASEESQTPGDYAMQGDRIRGELGREAIFVLETVPSFVRNRLVQAAVPFIVPGSQMFLPMLLVDLREYFPRKHKQRKQLLTSAQVIVLYQLTRGGLEGLAKKAIAEHIGYSAMMVSNATDDLQAHGLCSIEKKGRASSVCFPDSREELWQNARDLMRSPVRKTYHVEGATFEDEPVLAGAAALNNLSMLSADPRPTVAIYHKDFPKKLESGLIHVHPENNLDDDTTIEAWDYDPKLFTDGGIVDRFSLYLSLTGSPDERIQQELEHMMETIKW